MGKFVTDLTEVDSAFLSHLQGLSIDGKQVPILFVNPTPEIQIEELPSIVIYRNGIYPDMYSYRWIHGFIYSGVDRDSFSAKKRRYPMPYQIYYSIRPYYQYQEDGAKMNLFITNKLRRGSYLKINDYNYDVEFVSYSNPNAGYKNYGEFQKDDKAVLFDQYLFKISVDIDFDYENDVDVKLAKEVILTPNLMEIKKED